MRYRVLHRDVKPGNVLLDTQSSAAHGEVGRPKLGDFGLARVPGTGAGSLTQTGELVGTVEYMAPEQAEGGLVVDERSDLYALGCTLYCCLAGAPPFPGTGADVIAKHLMTAPPPLRGRMREPWPELEAFVLQLLEKNAADRPATAREAALRLEALAGSSRGRGRSPLARGLLGASAALGLAVGVALALSSARSRAPASAPLPSPATLAHPAASPSPTPSAPEWYRALPEAERPPLPLPEPLAFGSEPDEYVARRDASILVFVPGGRCRLGSTEDESREENERPAHDVVLSPYFVGKYEVSHEQFACFVKATGYRTGAEVFARKLAASSNPPDLDHVDEDIKYGLRPGGHVLTRREDKSGTIVVDDDPQPRASWRDPHADGVALDPRQPVVQVSRTDALEYCDWAKLRLPTEAEWERAARWDEAVQHANLWPWGDAGPESMDPRVANYAASVAASNEKEHLVPVRSFPKGRSPVGACQMAGNVRELVLDTDEAHTYERIVAGEVSMRDPCFVQQGGHSLTRGGNYKDTFSLLRCACRRGVTGPDDATGFRVALSLDRSPRPVPSPASAPSNPGGR